MSECLGKSNLRFPDHIHCIHFCVHNIKIDEGFVQIIDVSHPIFIPIGGSLIFSVILKRILSEFLLYEFKNVLKSKSDQL